MQVMRGSIYRLLVLLVVTGLVLPIAGQVPRYGITATTTTNGSQRQASMPYTVEYRITRVRALGNGTALTHQSSEVKAMDSEGRQMIASSPAERPRDKVPTTLVGVTDPVARTNISWYSPGKRATLTTTDTLLASGRNCAKIAKTTSTPDWIQHEKSETEDLGTATIQGIEAHGKRISTTVPAGAFGNDAPFVSVSETWTAVDPALKDLLVRQKTVDPRIGSVTTEVVSFMRGEPDPATFQPPEGYEVVERTASDFVCN